MMLDKIHPSIRSALLVFCVIFLVATISVVTSHMYLENISDAEKKAKRNTLIWKSKIEQAKENNRIIVEYEKPYLKLIEDGVIGEENRLSWFEALQATASSRGLDTFKFSTASQTMINPTELGGAYANLGVYKSIMTLNMSVSHEGDMFAVFNDLDTNAKGLYSVNTCNVVKTRIEAKKSETLNFGIKANCQLTWYSIKPQETEG